MTLIITGISEFGIAMVADSAITQEVHLPSGFSILRILNGAQKLQVVPQLRAGISMWGYGSVKTPRGEIPADIWMADFIRRRIGITSLDDFASNLAQELEEANGEIKKPMGFHLAAYVTRDGERHPVFYHIRNCDGDFRHYEQHSFIPGLQIPPEHFPTEIRPLIRNGDYGPYAILEELSKYGLEAIKRVISLEIPSATLWGRMSYHSAWIRFVSDLYASSERIRTIGGGVTSLMIPPEGEIIYQSA